MTGTCGMAVSEQGTRVEMGELVRGRDGKAGQIRGCHRVMQNSSHIWYMSQSALYYAGKIILSKQHF